MQNALHPSSMISASHLWHENNSMRSINTSHSPETRLNFLNRLKILLIKKCYSLASLALRVSASFSSLFGKKGQNFAEIIHDKRFQLKLIRKHYKLDLYPHKAPLPLLMRTRNISEHAVLSQGKDMVEAHSLMQQFRSSQFSHKNPDMIDPAVWEMFPKVKLGRSKGICDAASLWIIKTVAERFIQSEDQLKLLLKPYVRGFSAHVAAMQAVRGGFKKEVREWISSFKRQVEQEQNVEKLNALTEKAKHMRIITIKTLDAFSRVWGIRSQEDEERNFKFDCDASATNGFNALPKGTYWIEFTGCKHAIAHLKFNFGSYLFDPNLGLMKCNQTSQDLLKIRKLYSSENKEEPYRFRVERYVSLAASA